MFTIEQVQAIHSQVKTGADFPMYIQNMKTLGVTYYDVFVKDGSTVYYGAGGYSVSTPATYDVKHVASTGSAEQLKNAISIHQQGQTDYPTFCEQAANAGVHKWTTDIINMEVKYVDTSGNILLREAIPQV